MPHLLQLDKEKERVAYLASLLSIFSVTTAGREQIYLSIAQPLPPAGYGSTSTSGAGSGSGAGARKVSSGAGAGAGAGAAPGTQPPASPIVGGGVRSAFGGDSKGEVAPDDVGSGPRRSPLTGGIGRGSGDDDVEAATPLLGSSRNADDLAVEDFDDGGVAGSYTPPTSSSG